MNTRMAPHTQVLISSSRQGIMKSDRRASKPLMEKRRRERINKSLNELKSILLDALRKESTCHSKLEKADILEMTVRYLRSIQRQRLSATMAMDSAMANKYRTGFVECKSEVAKFLEHSTDNFHRDVKSRLISHLGITSTNPNLIAGNSVMADPSSIASGVAHQVVPIQPSTSAHIPPMATAGAMMLGRCQRGLPTTLPKCSQMEFSQVSRNAMSPSSSPTYQSRHYRKSSSEYNTPSPMSPNSEPNSHHQTIMDNFFAPPYFPSFSPPTQQLRISPNTFSSSESSFSHRHDLPQTIRLSPALSTHSEESSFGDQTYFNSHVKCEPQSPSLESETGDVWRPW